MNLKINSLPNYNYVSKNLNTNTNQNNKDLRLDDKFSNFAYNDLVFRANFKCLKPNLQTPLQEKIFNNIKGFLSLPANSRIKNSYPFTSNGKNFQIMMELFRSANKTDVYLKVLEKESSNESIIKMVLNNRGKMISGSYKNTNTEEMKFTSNSSRRTLIHEGISYNQDNNDGTLWKKNLTAFNESKGDCERWSKVITGKNELECFFLEMTKKFNSFIYST